jgi:signal peptidase I
MPIDPQPIQNEPKGFTNPTVPDTLISVIIAFALAFIGRAYVLEPFVIPTGSMAPTLLGAHYRAVSDESGTNWPVDRQLSESGDGALVRDPYTATEFEAGGLRQRSGDRILVLKRTPFSPAIERFEVAVFRNPADPNENLIKRIIGMPGEQIALVDGDVFVRADKDPAPNSLESWNQPGWMIARKGEREQREVWQAVFDSARLPRGGPVPGSWPFKQSDSWNLSGTTLKKAGTGRARLVWDNAAWDIRDRLAYNDLDLYRDPRFGPGRAKNWLPANYPVSDLAISMGFEPGDADDELTIELATRKTLFRAVLQGKTVTLQSKADSVDTTQWEILDTAELPRPLPTGKSSLVEFWHADQSLWLFVNDRLICRSSYDWSIHERLSNSIRGDRVESILPLSRGMNLLSSTEQYTKPEISIAVTGGSAALHRLRVDRDLYYHPYQTASNMRSGTPPMGTHPLTTATLGRGQYFALGDNSPRSADGRVWPEPHPLVVQNFPATATKGVVPEELIIGRAFMVYFPSISRDGAIPVPDFGRVRPIH